MLKFVCLISALVAGCVAFEFPESFIPNGISLEDERIIGGEEAYVGNFPYLVSLRAFNGMRHYCGGSLISSRFILTSAGCTLGNFSNPENIRIVIGAEHIRIGGDHYAADKIIVHPKFNRERLLNAISLIRAAEEIVFGKFVAPIALPTSDVKGGVAATTTGWGQYVSGDPQDPTKYPTQLQWIDTKTLNRDECIRRLGSQSRPLVHANSLCTTNPEGVGACNLDNGGPLVNRKEPRVLLGVFSWSVSCGEGKPDVYVRVYPHLAFIRQAMQE